MKSWTLSGGFQNGSRRKGEGGGLSEALEGLGCWLLPGGIGIKGGWDLGPGTDGARGQMPWFCYRILEPLWARCCSCSSALQPSAGGLPVLLTLREVSQKVQEPSSLWPCFFPRESWQVMQVGVILIPFPTSGQPPCSLALGTLCPSTGLEALSPAGSSTHL